MTVEIYFRDLNEEAQQAVLEAAGISDPNETNWDVFPIAEVILGEGDEE